MCCVLLALRLSVRQQRLRLTRLVRYHVAAAMGRGTRCLLCRLLAFLAGFVPSEVLGRVSLPFFSFFSFLSFFFFTSFFPLFFFYVFRCAPTKRLAHLTSVLTLTLISSFISPFSLLPSLSFSFSHPISPSLSPSSG